MRVHRASSAQPQADQNKVTILIIATVLVFLVCQLPSALLLIYEAIFPLQNQNSKMAEDVILGLNNIANGLTAINASVNFILYSSFSEKFRQTFKELFLMKKKEQPKMILNNNIHKNLARADGLK
jgi:G protein-coupled receptor 139